MKKNNKHLQEQIRMDFKDFTKEDIGYLENLEKKLSELKKWVQENLLPAEKRSDSQIWKSYSLNTGIMPERVKDYILRTSQNGQDLLNKLEDLEFITAIEAKYKAKPLQLFIDIGDVIFEIGNILFRIKRIKF